MKRAVYHFFVASLMSGILVADRAQENLDDLLTNTFADEVLVAFADANQDAEQKKGLSWPGAHSLSTYTFSNSYCVVTQEHAPELYAFIAMVAKECGCIAPQAVYRECDQSHSFTYVWDDHGLPFIVIDSGASSMSEDAWKVEIAVLMCAQLLKAAQVEHYTFPVTAAASVMAFVCFLRSKGGWGAFWTLAALCAYVGSRFHHYWAIQEADMHAATLPGINLAKGLTDRLLAFPQHYPEESLSGVVLRGNPRLKSRINRSKK
jgi:hypothetical protein